MGLTPESTRRVLKAQAQPESDGSLENLLARIDSMKRSQGSDGGLTEAPPAVAGAAPAPGRRPKLRESSERRRSVSRVELGRRRGAAASMPARADLLEGAALMGTARRIVARLGAAHDSSEYPAPPFAPAARRRSLDLWRKVALFVSNDNPGDDAEAERDAVRGEAFRKVVDGVARSLSGAIDGGHVTARTLALETLVGIALPSARGVLFVDRCAFFRFGIDGQLYEAWRGAPGGADDGGDSEWYRLLAEACARDWKTLSVDDAYASPHCAPPLTADLATGYRTKTALAAPVAVDRSRPDDGPVVGGWTKLGVLIATNRLVRRDDRGDDAEVVHVRASATSHKTRIMEVARFDRADEARAAGVVDALRCVARILDDDELDAADTASSTAASRAATPSWLRAFEQQKRDRARRQSSCEAAGGGVAAAATPSPGGDRKRRPRRQTFAGA